MTGRGKATATGHLRTMVDAKLMEKAGLPELTLRRVRRAFLVEFQSSTYQQRSALMAEGICARFNFMNRVLIGAFTTDEHAQWLRYLEHSAEDIADMCRGEYPISPYIIRVYSALFAIKVDFLLAGANPQLDRIGANIDVWPVIAQH